MSPVGRNDPCPCGSGKKYKKCCGASADTAGKANLLYDHLRQLDTKAGNLILRFARQLYGDDVLEHAWEDFFFGNDVLFESSHPDFDYFERWFTYDWRPEGEASLGELFLSERGLKTDATLRRFIATMLRSPYSFWQVLESESGVGVKLHDVFRKHDAFVIERSGSTTLERGYIIYARVVEMDDISFIVGCGTHVFPASYLGQMLDLRTSLEKAQAQADKAIRAETLVEFEDDLRDFYFELTERLEKRRFDIRNTDGDPLSFHTLTYDIASFNVAFHALKDLQQKATGASDTDLLTRAERDPAGESTEIEIHWLKSQKKPHGEGATSLASIRITSSSLVVEVNSEKRSNRVQKEIKKRLGNKAVLLRTEIKSREGILKEVAEKREHRAGNEEDEKDRLLDKSPEVKALMKRLMDEHWATWPDIPLPALRGMTPRQAAKNPDGREMLESLLMEFELRNGRKEDENLRVNISKLRRDLGLVSD